MSFIQRPDGTTVIRAEYTGVTVAGTTPAKTLRSAAALLEEMALDIAYQKCKSGDRDESDHLSVEHLLPEDFEDLYVGPLEAVDYQNWPVIPDTLHGIPRHKTNGVIYIITIYA